MLLERMDDFFAARLEGYDAHMKTEIEGAQEFYTYTASLLPKKENASVLDLGCGTGLELEAYFRINPSAYITGIDLSKDMLEALKAKFPDKNIRLLCGSYFDIPFGEGRFDAAVSVESLHHFPFELKVSLYGKLKKALRKNGYFVLTDYFAESEKLEKEYFATLERLKREQHLPPDVFCHYDTPLTVDHEILALKSASFTAVNIRKNWNATFTLTAE